MTKAPTADGTGSTDLAAGIDLLLRPPRRRGLAVVVSDFLSTGGWERTLRTLATRHQVLAIEVVDPRELELPNVGYLTVVDPETGRLREIQTARPAVRARYAEAAAAERKDIAASIRRAGAQHLILRTDRDWIRDIVEFVVTTKRRGAGYTAVRARAGHQEHGERFPLLRAPHLHATRRQFGGRAARPFS